MLSSTAFSAPPKFKKKFKKMRQKFEKAFLVDFANKQMMPKKMWQRRYKLYDIDDPDDAHFSARAIYQFHYHFHPGRVPIPRRKICDLDWYFDDRSLAWGDECCENTAYEDVSYPQMDLEECYFAYEKYAACSFMPKLNNVEKHKELYLKIKSVEEDPALWVEALMEANDHDFVRHSIEYRLGGNLDNEVLWLIYIDYLEIHDCQKLLQTYSKFIRFFLEDVDMINEYREAVKKHGPVLVPWKNTQDFETFDEHFFEKEAECQSYQRTLPVESPPTLPRFNAENMIRQAFPFHENLMLYIRKNASAEVLHKLYKTCKFFYQRFPKTLCYKVEVNEMNLGWNDSGEEVDDNDFDEEIDDDDSDEEVDEDSDEEVNNDDSDEEVDDDSNATFVIKNLYLKVTSEWLANTPINNFFIGNVFRCVCEDPLALSRIIPKIYKCSATIIEIYRQEFSFDDLKVLINHGNVLALDLHSPENDNGSCLILEDILQMTPCIKRFSLSNRVQCTSNTAKKLCEMEFKNKIDCFKISNLTNDLLDPHDFAKFIKKNCLRGACVRINFKFDSKEAYVANFKAIFDAALGSFLEEDIYRVQ